MTMQTIDRLPLSPGETAAQHFEQIEQQSGVGSVSSAAAPSQQNQVRYVPAGTGASYRGPGSLMRFIITGKESERVFPG